MASIPLPMNKLEDIVTEVARDLLENWAINDRFKEEEMIEAGKNSVDDTIFVINNFMEHFNQYMLVEAENQKLI